MFFVAPVCYNVFLPLQDMTLLDIVLTGVMLGGRNLVLFGTVFLAGPVFFLVKGEEADFA